jgi:dihydroxyacetone kinase
VLSSAHFEKYQLLIEDSIVLKVLGAAAANGVPFEELLSLGNALNGQIVSIATTLDHCHVPGRAEHQQLDDSTIEIGTGPHNEPVSSTFSKARSFVSNILEGV